MLSADHCLPQERDFHPGILFLRKLFSNEGEVRTRYADSGSFPGLDLILQASIRFKPPLELSDIMLEI